LRNLGDEAFASWRSVVKSMKRVAGVSLVVALASLAVLEGLSWAYTAPMSRSRQSEVLLERIAARTDVLDRLRGGELTVVEAAAKFRDLNADPDSDAEKLCHQIISLATAQESAAPSHDQGKALAQRLEDELDQHVLSNDGRVVLASQ